MAAVSFLPFFQLANKSASFCIQLQQMPMNFLAFALPRSFVCLEEIGATQAEGVATDWGSGRGWGWGRGRGRGRAPGASPASGDGAVRSPQHWVLSLWRGTKLSVTRLSVAASGFPSFVVDALVQPLTPHAPHPIPYPRPGPTILPSSFGFQNQWRWHFRATTALIVLSQSLRKCFEMNAAGIVEVSLLV